MVAQRYKGFATHCHHYNMFIQVTRHDLDNLEELPAQNNGTFCHSPFCVFFVPDSREALRDGKIEFRGATKSFSYDIFFDVASSAPTELSTTSEVILGLLYIIWTFHISCSLSFPRI